MYFFEMGQNGAKNEQAFYYTLIRFEIQGDINKI